MMKKSLSTLAAIAFVATLGLGASVAGCGFGVTEPTFQGDTANSPRDQDDPKDTALRPGAHVDLAGLLLETGARTG